MSSKYMGLRRVGIVGLSTLVAASMMTLNAGTAQAAFAPDGGQIGIVDTVSTTPGTQGATLVTPGVTGQALADVQLLIPNTFQNGDTIDLTIFDRTATNSNAGQINADTAHKLGFTGAPTVTVNATPVIPATNIGPSESTAGDTQNSPQAAAAGLATTAPVFAASVVQSSRANGLATDIIRLRINAVQATGTATSGATAPKWIVTLSGIKADLGLAVSPGELRVVPFAYDGTPGASGTTSSSLFGNTPDPVENPGPQIFNPVIKTYTVPAYVSPVTFDIGTPSNVVADGTIQSVGDIIIAETNAYSLQDGTYTVNVAGATVANTTANPMTITGTGFTAPGETVVKAGAPNVISFTVGGALQTTKVAVKISGLVLTSGTPGPITYTLTGGSIDTTPNAFLVKAGTSGVIGAAPPNGVLADSAFGGTVNQNDIQAPKLVVNAVSSDIVHRIGGSDRYETAAKIALNGSAQQRYIVLASGENFPDALSSGYLAANLDGGGNILLTRHNVLPAVTADAMRLLGTRTVYVVGGPGAVNDSVLAQLRATPQYQHGGLETVGQGKLQVIRLGGIDRYATNKVVNQYAAALFQFANPVGRTSITFGKASKLTALVATGEVFADALSAGPATAGAFGDGAVNGSLPLILTRSTSLDPNASSQLNNLGIQQAVVLGLEGAVSASVASSITGMGIAVKRIGGATRYETSAMIADFETADVQPTATTEGGLGFDQFSEGNDQRAYLATGVIYADALAGAPLAGGSGSPILLTAPTTLSPATATWLSVHSAAYVTVVALGLAGAVSNGVLDAANAAVAAH